MQEGARRCTRADHVLTHLLVMAVAICCCACPRKRSQPVSLPSPPACGLLPLLSNVRSSCAVACSHGTQLSDVWDTLYPPGALPGGARGCFRMAFDPNPYPLGRAYYYSGAFVMPHPHLRFFFF